MKIVRIDKGFRDYKVIITTDGTVEEILYAGIKEKAIEVVEMALANGWEYDKRYLNDWKKLTGE